MKRVVLFTLICMLLACAATGLADANLLVNPSFEEVSSGRPVGWGEDMWLHDVGVSYLEVRENGKDGGYCAMIENVASNDARFVQDISVEPNTVYHFSGWVKAEDCNPQHAGASLSVIGAFKDFPEVHDTAGDWVLLECYIQTAANQSTLTVGPRLGGYSADNTGKAWFDDLSFVRADILPVETGIIMLDDYSNTQTVSNPEPVKKKEGTVSILPGVIAFAAVLFLIWALRPYGKAAIFVVMALALVVRIYLMMTQPGYGVDIGCFYSWSNRMVDVGPNAFYAADYFCDYPPGYMYLLWFTGALMRLFGVAGINEASLLIIKFVPMVFDMGAIWLLWKLTRKQLGENAAVALAALYAFSPAVLVDGAIWGQVDSVIAFGLLCTVALVLNKKWMAALPVYIVTVLMKPQALMAGPLGLVALVLDIFPWKEESKKTLKDAAVGLGIGIGVAALMLLPYVWGKENPIGWIIEHYAEAMTGYPNATINAANLYYMVGANWAPLTEMLGPFTYQQWGTALMVVIVVGTVAVFAIRRDRELLPFFGAMAYIGLFLFGIMMHERYLFPALILLLLAYVKRRDWRLLAMFVGYSVTFFMNCAALLPDQHLPGGFNLGWAIVSGVNILLYGLGIWMMFDKKVRMLPVWDNSNTRRPKDRLPALDGPSAPVARMRRKDWVCMLSLTLVYAAIAYIGLGATAAPQTVWSTTGTNEQVVFDLGAEHDVEIMFYPGINGRDHSFGLEFSADGANWENGVELKATPGDCFRWQFVKTPIYDSDGLQNGMTDETATFHARYVRLKTEGPGLTLMEVAFRDVSDGTILKVAQAVSQGGREESAYDPVLLVDESATMPETPSYYNSTYFDEIYHARTGYEHAHGLSTYEWTHPPLGKVLIMFAIKIFGMTPFGWRFMGALMGVLMVPAMYMLGKVLFKKTRYAFLAAFVMAFDMMHLTQTRIATIDSFAVLFIILMYLFMFRYMQMSFFRDGWRTLIPLGLSGLFMGLGCASKWICMYAGAGLAVLFAWTMVQRFLEWRAGVRAGGEMAEKVAGYPRYLVGTLLLCLLFFVAIPFAIYYFSYIPQFAWEGGLNWKRFWETQESIFSYHANLVDDHAFQSPWYEWPLMLKPMYYFSGTNYAAEGMVSTIMCMGNPAVWWIGLAAFLYVVWRWMKPHILGIQVEDHRPAMLLLAFAAQFLPWVLVPRSTFIYHYFGSLPFVMMCIVYAAEQIYAWNEARAKVIQYVYMAAVVVLFVGFYPFATGVQMPEAWAKAMNWLNFLQLPGWKFRGWLYY